jgi:hypothetical protein
MKLFDLEKYINVALQKDVEFAVNSKTLKTGKLILFSVKEFYLNFKLISSGKEYKSFEIPYPFSFYTEGNRFYFDYTLKSLYGTNKELEQQVKFFRRIKFSKLYDNMLIVTHS